MSARQRAQDRWGLDDAARAIANDSQPFASRTPRTDVCNTRSADTECPLEPRIGVDTVSWCWSDPEAVDRLQRLEGLVPDGGHRPIRIVPAPGGAVRVSHRLDGLGQLGAFPGASMLFVEGRARALHRADETDHGLGRPADLAPTEADVIRRLSHLLGATPTGAAGVRRIDLTGELRFQRGEQGREFLSLLDALHSPRHRTSPVREVGGPGIETAYWRTPKRSIPVLRAYDKGIESGTAAPGERIRIERQIRFAAKQRPALPQLLQRDLAQLYTAPIRTWLKDGVVIGSAGQIIDLLLDAGELWPAYWSAGCRINLRTGNVHHRAECRCKKLWPAHKAERVLGTLFVIERRGARGWAAWSDKQRQRRMREARELGLIVTDQPVTVDVDQAVNQLCDLWQEAA